MGPKQVLPLWVRVDLGVMAIKGWLHSPQSSRTGKSPQDVVFCHTDDTQFFARTIPCKKLCIIGMSYLSAGDAVVIF